MKLEQLIQLDDPTKAIMELDSQVNELSGYGEDLSKLSEPQKVLLFVENLEREINNGGFNQFFWNSSGNYTHETLAALKAIGANKTANIVAKAIAQWPNNKVPSNRDKREELLEEIEEKADPIWNDCDKAFYAYEDDIAKLLFAYVKKNVKSFQ